MLKKILLSGIFCEVEPPATLCSTVLSRIAKARRRAARIQFTIQTSIGFISGMLLVPLASSIGQELHTSGFYEYVSLFFTLESDTLSASWTQLAYSLLESLPSVALLLTSFTLGVLGWSVYKMLGSRRAAFSSLVQL